MLPNKSEIKKKTKKAGKSSVMLSAILKSLLKPLITIAIKNENKSGLKNLHIRPPNTLEDSFNIWT